MSEDIAEKIVDYIKDRVLVKYPFLGMIVANLKVRIIEGVKDDIAVDWIGLRDGILLIDRKQLLNCFKNSEDQVYLMYIHSLLHYLYCHDILYADSEGEQIDLHVSADKIVDEVLCEMEGYPIDIRDDHNGWKKETLGGREALDEGMVDARKAMSKKVLTNIETFSKNQAGKGMVLTLRRALRDKLDYSEMLKQFVTPEEILKVSQDEFDYGLYSYGLSINPDMPIVEMIETSDDKLIRGFVIAIDTSGSTAGDTVQMFLDKTYSVLCTQGIFSENVNIYVIQCDSSIRKESVIHNRDEIHKVCQEMTVSGFGTTDFRPVFERVDELLKMGELSHLKGLIYFTDGRGTYPVLVPSYKTAFVITEEMYDSATVPNWAVKIMI